MEKYDPSLIEDDESLSESYVNSVHEASVNSIYRFHMVSSICVQNIIKNNESCED